MAKSSAKVIRISEPTNGAAEAISFSEPYRIEVTVEGVADILFHRWNVEAVEAKSNAAKGSKARKSDDIESYVYRDEGGMIALPGEYLRGAIINAAKYRQDPRSPRKSAMDIFRAGIVSLTPLASFGVKDWDYEHKCRVTVNRSGITRCRPALRSGWRASFILSSLLPEYIPPEMLNEVISSAGRLVGLADFRPTYGRFNIVNYELLE